MNEAYWILRLDFNWSKLADTAILSKCVDPMEDPEVIGKWSLLPLPFWGPPQVEGAYVTDYTEIKFYSEQDVERLKKLLNLLGDEIKDSRDDAE